MAKKRILTQDEIDRYINNLDELSELSEDGLEYFDDDVDFLPDCVSSNHSDSDWENSVGSQNTIQNIKKSDDDNKLDRNISAREPFLKYRQEGKPDLGASANVVIRLAGIISRNKTYTLYFHNYYTSIPLLAYLSKEGVYSLGTINRNIIPNSKIPTEKVFNKMERGHSMEFVGNYNDVEISVTTWKDNKTLIMASTFADEKPLGKVMRYDKKIKNRVEITMPHVIKEYNKHMGVASCLCKMGYNENAKRGRPSNTSIEQMFQTKRYKVTAQSVPCKDIRRDSINHWPIWSEKRIRCKFPNCKGYTQTE
ncbi:piggyBac transposable element-derived protein 3 [Nephila pilipes]|uniref:PiggyBac transposable element-derived protein 3 n=1 Tax=Nephila pilipes TaxID=299642 RepID=A0A8X6TNY5_NEPPI|nr:piggyBac transposable element-derived protein 3 [Nephila pilipes]